MPARMYAIVDLTRSMVCSLAEEAYQGDPPPYPPVPEGHELVPFTADDFDGLTEQEFLDQKKPVLVEGAFDHWSDRHSGLSLTISATPKNDGSNTPYVSLRDGLPDSPFMATSSTGIALNAQATGVLDDTGDGSFRVKVTDGSITSGSVTVSPDGHQDFVPATFSFDVEAGDF